MGHPRLSICIPTYNFGEFIGETLDSIVSQATDETEIVIVDGASTDNTEQIVQEFQRRFSCITYHCREVNMGVDKDLAKAVELAQGDYCWLMSSDDVLMPGAVRRVSDEIRSGYAVYLGDRIDCDRLLNPIREKRWFTKHTHDRVFDLSSEAGLLTYLNEARSLGALFSYISTIVFARKEWNAIAYDETLSGTHYAHVYRLFSALKQASGLKYLDSPLVWCRGDNDSFATSGYARRMLIDINGYENLAAKLFDRAPVQEAFKSVLQKEYTWYVLAGLRRKVGDSRTWARMESRLLAYGFPRGKLIVARVLGALGILANAGRVMRNTFDSMCYRLNSNVRRGVIGIVSMFF